jgi:hypothetical protein
MRRQSRRRMKGFYRRGRPPIDYLVPDVCPLAFNFDNHADSNIQRINTQTGSPSSGHMGRL